MSHNKNEIIVGDCSGFCFGVKRAANDIEKKIDSAAPNERIYTLGKLIHNDTYNKYLASRGVQIVSKSDLHDLASSASKDSQVTLFIRAHGTTQENMEHLVELAANNIDFNFVDCTCPYVKKIHIIAAENSGDDKCFILMGEETHPEVVGILSYFKGEKHVFCSAEALAEAVKNKKLVNLHKKNVIIAAQTTFNSSEWKKSQEIFKKLCTNPIIFDTICGVTEKRQAEAKGLSEQCDIIIVIGGRDSSNTAKLYDICKKGCPSTYLVADDCELREILPKIKSSNFNVKTGIVAGASTPADIIQEVLRTMSETTEIKAETFEEMLESSLKTLNTGETVTGTITSVTDAELQLDLGAKVTGVIASDQATDDPAVKLTELFKVGDQIKAFVIKVSDVDGVATLSKRRVDADKNWQTIITASENEEILEGIVTGVNKGGIEVKVNSNRIFVPASQTGVPRGGDMSELVGNTVRLRIIEVKEQRKRAVGSIRLVLREERKEREVAFWDNIEVDKKFTGKVKSMTSYGAFVDLGGVDGMVHTSELSWKHIKSPAEVVSIGDEITVYVKSYDPERKRISLGYKTEETEPWRVFRDNYNVGDIVKVKIVNLMPFGAFAEIVSGVDGLIHISQISMTRIVHPQDVLSYGDVVDVKIIGIDDEERKISLSIRSLLEEIASQEIDDAYLDSELSEQQAFETDETIAETQDDNSDVPLKEYVVTDEASELSEEPEHAAETESDNITE